MSDDLPELGDVINIPDAQHPGDQRWIVLYPDDYQSYIRGVDGNIGVLVDQQQAGELLRVLATILADLSHRDADADDVLDDMIDALTEVKDAAE